MKSPTTIVVADIISSPLCISAEDGNMVYEQLLPLLQAGTHVILSFEGVTTLISLFLNAAIGQLYGTLDEDQVRSQLQVVGLAADDLEILKRVVDNAKRYYANPGDYDQAWETEGEDEE